METAMKWTKYSGEMKKKEQLLRAYIFGNISHSENMLAFGIYYKFQIDLNSPVPTYVCIPLDTFRGAYDG